MKVWVAVDLINNEADLTVLDSQEKADKYREDYALEIWDGYMDRKPPFVGAADILFESNEFISNGDSFYIECQDVL